MLVAALVSSPVSAYGGIYASLDFFAPIYYSKFLLFYLKNKVVTARTTHPIAT